MSWNTLLFGVLPLIIFVIIDTFAGLKAGIISAIAFAIIEIIYSYFYFKKIDSITIGSTILVLVCGIISYQSENPAVFKLQPVILGLLFSGILLIFQLTGRPLLPILAVKWKYMFPAKFQNNVHHPLFVKMLSRLSLYLGVGLGLHALAVWYSVYFLSNWWWLAIRGVGLYLVMGFCVILTRFIPS